MINREENRKEYSGMAILFVLSFFLIFMFHPNSKNSGVAGAFQYQRTTLHSFAVPSKDVPQLSSLQGFISKVEVTNVKHFREQLRLLSDNKLITKRIILFQNVEILIKPNILNGFNYHHLVCYSDDLHHLG
jgi:hypothetical protein